MINAVLLFRQNRNRILKLGAVYDFWLGQAPLLQEQLDEVLRAQLVQTVSAFVLGLESLIIIFLPG